MDNSWICTKCKRIWNYSIEGCLKCNDKIDILEKEKKVNIKCKLCDKESVWNYFSKAGSYNILFCSPDCCDNYYGEK